MKFFYLIFILFLSAFVSSAQQANVWIFGDYATLDFNYDPPREFEAAFMNWSEGPSSICDEYGNLLLYTNGLSVYNAQHQLIGDSLKGDVTTTQTSLILPHPSKKNIFYLFTASGALLNPPNDNPGYFYSVIDMDINGGLGGFIKKNVFLHNDGTEKLTAIQSKDCKFSWILTQQVGTNIFCAYRLDEQGVNPTPVISPGGKTFVEKWFNSIGALKISPDGTKVAKATYHNSKYGWLEIFDFNMATGKVTNPKLIHDGGRDYSTYPGFYSVAFSPNSKVLYACHEGYRPVQIDLTQETFELIYFTDKPLRRIEAGPGNKLYAVLDEPKYREPGGEDGQESLNGYGKTISAIHEPDQLGEACQFEPYFYTLKKGYSVWSLPNFPQSFFYNDSLALDFSYKDNCLGQATQFDADLKYQVVDYWWNFDDPSSENDNTSVLEDPSHVFTAADLYEVTLHSIDLCLRHDELKKEVIVYPNPVFEIAFDTLQRCYYEDTFQLTLPHYEFTDYYINGSMVDDTVPLPVRGIYEIFLNNECFSQSDTFFYDLVPELIAPLPSDTFYCKGEVGILSAKNELADYQWNTGATSQTIEVYDEGEYFITLTSACQTLEDITTVKFIDKDIGRYVINVFTPNGDQINDFFENYSVHSPNYRHRIYNRWGSLIFETNDPDVYWDGNVNGVPATSGNYFYITEAMNCHAEPITIKGYFSLLK